MNTKSFATLVQEQVAAIQGTAKALVDLTIGSILRAATESVAAVALWLQGLIIQLLAITRAATCSGADLDSFVGDFGVKRLPAVAATGPVTFARFTPTLQAVVLVGATVQTADGTQQFTVTLDTGNPAYSASLGGYVLAASVASINVPVVASIPGSGANVVAGAINTLTQAISGVDTVTNAADFTNGVDAEKDPALRTRFIAYIASLSKATKDAIGYAITSLQQGLTYLLIENQTYAGATQYGYFYVVVDDGTGNPPSSLLSTVYNAVDAVRPFTSTFGVFAPVVVGAAVAATINTATGYDHANTAALVTDAIKNYINTLALGQTLTYTRLAQVAYDASPGVTNVTAVTLNGGTVDLSITGKQIVKWTSVSVA